MKNRIFIDSPYFYGLIIAIATGVGIFLYAGEIRTFADMSLIDVLAEGSLLFLAIFWLVLLVKSRPKGLVTQLLALGLCCIIFSWAMDFTDEFIHLPSTSIWRHSLESVSIPFALIFLSIGLFHWHKEEIAISEQMVKRERYFRDHRFFDKLIPVGAASYFRKQLKIALTEAKSKQQPLALIAVDIDDFNSVNRVYGVEEGDHILQLLCQLLLLNLRDEDLLCRLAGDRFVILLSNTNEYDAKLIARDLARSVDSFTYRTKSKHQRVVLSASVAVSMAQTDDSDSLIQRLNLELDKVKQRVQHAV